ncbi:hypothetical protein EJB05_22732, partial [Eragrostis curvula]
MARSVFPTSSFGTAAIAGGVAAGAALMSAAPAVAFAMWRHCKPEEHGYINVPEQDVPERNEDEPEEVTMAIAPIYQGKNQSMLSLLALFLFPHFTERKSAASPGKGEAWCEPEEAMPPPEFRDFFSSASAYPAVHHAQLKKFLWWELHAATDNFNKNNILGRGAFGSVYKGRLIDGSSVAVKRQKERTPTSDLQFHTEIASHRNHLWTGIQEDGLQWDLQEVLSCLHDHCDPKIIHRDVKAANILLDEDFEAIVSDFGCAILLDCNDAHGTTVCGTIGHIAPEYCSTGSCSEKADVFSYGIMLLELITGKKAYDPARSANYVMLLDWVTRLFREKKVDEDFEMLVDPDLLLNYNKTEVESLVQVALLCTDASPSARPPMSEVLKLLEGDGLVERWEE